MNDHDLLITLIGEVKGLREEVGKMSTDTKDKLKDHEDRLRAIERYVWGAIAVLGALQVYFQYLK